LSPVESFVAHFAQHTCGESLFVLGDEACDRWRILSRERAQAHDSAFTIVSSRSSITARQASKLRGVSPVPPRAGMFSATVDASTVRRSHDPST